MNENELQQFRSLVNWITGLLLIALFVRMVAAPMPPLALFVAWVGIIACSLINVATGPLLSLEFGKKSVCALGLSGLTLVIAYNGGIDAPAIVFLPAATLTALLITKPKHVATGVLLACSPFLFLFGLKAAGLQPPAVIVAPELRLLAHCLWGLMGCGMIALLLWRVRGATNQQDHENLDEEVAFQQQRVLEN